MGFEIHRLLRDQRLQELDKRKQGQEFDPVWASGAPTCRAKPYRMLHPSHLRVCNLLCIEQHVSRFTHRLGHVDCIHM